MTQQINTQGTGEIRFTKRRLTYQHHHRHRD